MMNKILALSPTAIKKYTDWLKILPRLHPRDGLFLADFPRKWLKKFNLNDSTIHTDNWDEWDEKQIQEFFINLKNENGLISLNSPYEHKVQWEENFLKLSTEIQEKCIPVGSRNNAQMLPDFDNLDFNRLNSIRDTVSQFKDGELIDLLANYFLTTEKIAFVGRHNAPLNPSGKISNLTKLIQEILSLTKNNGSLGEILIYTTYDPRDHPYMKNVTDLHAILEKCFNGLKTPTYGIKYLCCAEAGTGDDLHARHILTKNVAFTLTDSISGKNSSQSITRIRDRHETERLLCKWIDEDHKLEEIISVTHKNFVT